MGKIPAPAPGVYADVPFDVYLSWDAVSQSQLKNLAQSPAHFRAGLVEPDEDKDALRIGRAIHCAVLEPHKFEKEFGVMEDGLDRRSKAGKDAWEAIKQSGATPIKQGEHEKVMAMRDAIFAHPAAAALLRASGPAELSLVWIDPETGVLCKARQDKHAHSIGGGVIADLKSTEDASAIEFAKTIFNFAYHRQGALYLRGSNVLGLPVEHYAMIAAEKAAPFAVAVYRLDEGAISAGDDEIGALLKLFARCTAKNEWPAYPATVQDIAIPEWAWAKSELLTKEIEAFAQ